MNSSKIDDIDGQHLIKYHTYMFSRIHTMKFQNKVTRDSFRFFCINYTDNLFNEGLNFSLFIDVLDTQLHYLTVWKTKKDWEISFKKAKEYSDVKAQVKEMGATMSIVGGDTSGRMTSKSNFNLFKNVSL